MPRMRKWCLIFLLDLMMMHMLSAVHAQQAEKPDLWNTGAVGQVLPMDTFPVTVFNDPGFQPIRRNDFDIAAGGLTLAGALYFIMFSTPWVILIGFVVFMLRDKRKRRAAQTTEDRTDI